MRRLKTVGLIIAVFAFVFALLRDASASWYAGNMRTNAYGVRANIWTPSEAPYLETSGQSNWVSLPTPHWMQAGWRYYQGWEDPIRYVEYLDTNGDYDLLEYGTQPWGHIVEYKVDNYNKTTTWCGYVEGVIRVCKIVRSAPSQVQVYSEVHESPNNELDTRFSAVYYKTSDDVWFLFNQANWREDCPYLVQKDENYYFRTFRGTCVYLPFVCKSYSP